MQTKAFIFDAINRLTALLINNLEISASNKKKLFKGIHVNMSCHRCQGVVEHILGYPLCVSHIGMTYGGSPSKGRERGIYLSPRPGNLIPGISLVLKMTRNVELSLIDYSII